jgi:hypothetical protein
VLREGLSTALIEGVQLRQIRFQKVRGHFRLVKCIIDADYRNLVPEEDARQLSIEVVFTFSVF